MASAEHLESIHWGRCQGIERNPKKMSGAWVFSGTRVPVSALFENLSSGASAKDFLDWYEGVEEWQVRAVLEYEAGEKSMRLLCMTHMCL